MSSFACLNDGGSRTARRASKKKKKSALNGIPEEEGIPDGDTDDEQIEKMQEMLQEMTLEKFESVSCISLYHASCP